MNYGDEVNILVARVQAKMDASTRYALENQRGMSEKQHRRLVELILEVVRKAKGHIIPELVADIRNFLGV
jgi:hypothetical protein